MFKDQSLFVIVDTNDGESRIFRVETTKEAQKEVCDALGAGAKALKENRESINFTGSYKPEQDEVLVIESFNIDAQILDAVKNPAGIAAFLPDKKNPPIIKAVFIGKYSEKNIKEPYVIAFQKFKKDQYIARMGINLFHNSNTFNQEKRFGICITDTVDCLIVNDQLRFTSYYFARQIFDLSDYYRQATDSDVEAFINNRIVNIENIPVFKSNADTWVRRKIALISDSGIFDKYTAKQIKEKAKGFKLNISTTKNKLNLPNDKKELKNILRFLDEEIYKGVFSEEILQTNSKRKVDI